MLKKYLFVLGLSVSALTTTANMSIAGNVDAKAVVITYANIARAGYEDSLITAKALQKAVDVLIAEPTDANLKNARAAWIAARTPYQQTEAFRFGNTAVDDWEGKVNAWPLDEGLIDYVAKDYGNASEDNGYYAVNVIANSKFTVNGSMVDASNISPKLLSDTLHEAGDIEANVATGYHAVEFLLWGQDLNGTGPGAGNRPASDFDTKNCTGNNCDRRIAYLTAATRLLISDLEDMIATAMVLKKRAEGGEAYDQMIGEGNEAGNQVVQNVIDALIDQTKSMERVTAALKLKPISFEGSNSLDDAAKVQ